jgi:hypothetical protein
MASINGDWFHSRSSSNLDELIAVRNLVLESTKPEYSGFLWSGSRSKNPLMYQFSRTANIQPSTMQTKIRAMIRFGFIKDNNTCPLQWTRMGSLWNELYTVGNERAAKKIYELILAISISIYAFNNSSAQYTINPENGEMPVKFLLTNLDKNNSISLKEFEKYVDGRTTRVGSNVTYWKTDLINSGLFKEEAESLVCTNKYSEFIQDIRNFQPTNIPDRNWKEIRENPLIEISPFRNSVRLIFDKIINEQSIEEQITDAIFTDPIVDIISEQEEISVPEIDILSRDSRFTQCKRRIRNATWSIRIKKKYQYMCSVPNCDVKGHLFVESAHIKPDSITDGEIPHRAHILNGLCLCKLCHISFEKGLFSLTDDHKIITSQRFSNIPDQNLKTVIISSANIKIKNRTDNRFPLVEFIRYHRNRRFKK